jgi:hypothetical protein
VARNSTIVRRTHGDPVGLRAPLPRPIAIDAVPATSAARAESGSASTDASSSPMPMDARWSGAHGASGEQDVAVSFRIPTHVMSTAAARTGRTVVYQGLDADDTT